MFELKLIHSEIIKIKINNNILDKINLKKRLYYWKIKVRRFYELENTII